MKNEERNRDKRMGMKKISVLLILGFPIAVGLLGIKPVKTEFVCEDGNTTFCSSSWSHQKEYQIEGKPVRFELYGYTFFNHPFFWEMLIFKRVSDQIIGRETLVSWFKLNLAGSKLIPDLEIESKTDDRFVNFYEAKLDERQSILIIMGLNSRFYWPKLKSEL